MSTTRDLPRTIGFWGAAGIMIGTTIGSGIFRVPAEIASLMGNPWAILSMWVAGGLLCFFGALSYTELAVIYPRSGGLYNFLYQAFGPRVSFTFGWSYMLLIKPFGACGIAIVFAEHLDKLCGIQAWCNTITGDSQFMRQWLGVDWCRPLIVCMMLTILTWINSIGMRLGSAVGVFLTAIKVAALAAIVVLSFALGKGSAGNFASAPVSGVWYFALAAVMSKVLWTYDGWSDVGAVAGEVQEPQKTLPRVYVAGTLGVLALYLLVNAAYMWIVPLAQMQKAQTVAPIVMERLVGASGAGLITAIVLISTLGSTHASVITGARISFAQAQDGLLFRFLGKIDARHGTPAVSLWFQLLMSCIAVLALRKFSALADGFVFTMWIFYGLAAAAVIVLRIRRPDLERPYRCPGYPVVPAIFVLASAAMTVMEISDGLRGTVENGVLHRDYMPLVWLVVLAAGLPAYSMWRWTTGESGREDAAA